MDNTPLYHAQAFSSHSDETTYVQENNKKGLFSPVTWVLLVTVALFFCFPPLSSVGLWDPHELNTAELARPIAGIYPLTSFLLQVLDLSLHPESSPAQSNLPFLSVALGFKMFGLSEWAGRFPLAVWGLAGVMTTYSFVARLFDTRAGMYAAISLATMPLYFVHARSMLTGIVPMSSFAMSFGGISVLLFASPLERERGWIFCGKWLFLAAIGLYAGLKSNGIMLGVGVPLAANAITWWLWRWTRDDRRYSRVKELLAGALLIGTLVILGRGFYSLHQGEGDLFKWMGTAYQPPSKYTTFDYYIGHLGAALAPWSVLIPFALGRLFILPEGVLSADRERQMAGRAALMIGTVVAFGMHAYLAPFTSLMAFTGIALLAASCGVVLRDGEQGASPSIALGIGAVFVAALLLHDFIQFPEKTYQAWTVQSIPFPDSFVFHSQLLWGGILIAFAGFVLLSWVEGGVERVPFSPRRYLNVLCMLCHAWGEFLGVRYELFLMLAVLVSVVMGIATSIKMVWLLNIPSLIRIPLLYMGWISFLPVVFIFASLFLSDLWVWIFEGQSTKEWTWKKGFEPIHQLFDTMIRPNQRAERWVALFGLFPLFFIAPALLAFGVTWKAGLPIVGVFLIAGAAGWLMFLLLGFVSQGLLKGKRLAAVVLAGLLSAFALELDYYPALLQQVSPKVLFQTYQAIRFRSEPLGLLGTNERAAVYYAGEEPVLFTDTEKAYAWISEKVEGRRFLVIRANYLSELNQLYRGGHPVKSNIPVIASQEGQAFLIASFLKKKEINRNPLENQVLLAPPVPQHPLYVNLDDQLVVLGFDITAVDGTFVDLIMPTQEYHMKTYYQLKAPLRSTSWEAFLHIDGYRRRYNGDHALLQNQYPMKLWLSEDVLVDDYEFRLGPEFKPGTYTIFFGLFSGESRMRVKSGPQDGENRIKGGLIRVI
ncbi:hypothetical protein BCY86_06135 [Pajaroellobacter abortibovis]|uniref:Glycosyltransferase RgtA/B/C/D-like domain-containing protein n=2 Tax=Pajaroellobacter abortibovis TaxID=1882918 RepID=A0A1L6MXV5_9BACT|nr:hypothetical protein BCY86_06135 [Pajaroellobacter abortibovis]